MRIVRPRFQSLRGLVAPRYLLDALLERKRCVDMLHSIRDGRCGCSSRCSRVCTTDKGCTAAVRCVSNGCRTYLASHTPCRYGTQKYRMQRCGLRRLFVLLEEPIDQQTFQGEGFGCGAFIPLAPRHQPWD
jgi:hypothetical protein